MRLSTRALTLSASLLTFAVPSRAEPPTSLGARLERENPDGLAKDARAGGDAGRGALLFFRQSLGCAKCHDGGEKGAPALGPDLAREGKGLTGSRVVEAILSPSKSIRNGYETVTLATTDGRTLTGLLASETPDSVVLRDLARDGGLVTVPRADIDVRTVGGPSLMPAGLVEQLGSRQEFLDLVRYVLDVAEQGPARAAKLRPTPAMLAPLPLPDYERTIDHAGMIAALGPKSYERGEAIYQRVCANCHGTVTQPGSLPTSLRFASGVFKNGGDPYRMYQTLTLGFGRMAPQSWMVPSQKYDVIHYIREAFLKPHNSSQYVKVDRDFLARLPKGNSRGPEPSTIEPWVSADYGPSLMATIELGSKGDLFAYKGIAVRLDDGPGGVSRGRRFLVYDHDTLSVPGAWDGPGFIDWHGINFDGEHAVHPRAVGKVEFTNPVGPGWADPTTGSFDDPRPLGRDGRPYGPLPRAWGHYLGTYHHGRKVVVSYTIGDARILDSPGTEPLPGKNGGPVVLTRTIEVGKSSRDLEARVADGGIGVAIVGESAAKLVIAGGSTRLRIPASSTPLVVKLLLGTKDAGHSPPPEPLAPLTRGGPPRWAETLKTRAVVGKSDGPFAVDTLTLPVMNPWLCQLRLTGFDFLPGGKGLAVCTWDGDVWVVGGVDDLEGEQTWRRIASGLFQPLGLKVLKGRIYVGCRDQIVVLHDLNGDGETDLYENFNNDHQVTEHFHEFAMDLQTDAEGNFYYAKAARHAKAALVPQHGTLLKVGKDGLQTEILATGFRAPNGVCLNPDGSFFLTDQEGFWTPKNRINRVVKGGFYGNMWGYHGVTDPADSAMEPPLCWITNAMDRSPAETLWVTSDAWGPLKGSLLNLSYGEGKVYVVPFETVGGQAQGGVSDLPIPRFPTGVMRGRFHPEHGQLYLCGMVGWASNQSRPGGFYRLRYTGKPVCVPVGLNARTRGMSIKFSAPLDRRLATVPGRYAVSTWSLKRSEKYGSEHHAETPSRVASAILSDDGRTVFLEITDIAPTWCMKIEYRLRSASGEAVEGQIHNTVHLLRE